MTTPLTSPSQGMFEFLNEKGIIDGDGFMQSSIAKSEEKKDYQSDEQSPLSEA